MENRRCGERLVKINDCKDWIRLYSTQRIFPTRSKCSYLGTRPSQSIVMVKMIVLLDWA
jgi:hypothetical protein